MYPEQPQPFQTPPPPDYLNQIAPQTNTKKFFTPSPKLFAIIGGILVLLVIILSITVNAIAGGQRQPLQQLAARLSSTETVVNDAQQHLKSSQLRSLNSNLKIYLTNTNRDVAAPLLSAGVNTAKLSESVVAAESTTKLSETLENARLNVDYDRTYAREMAYRLDTILILMQKIYSSTNNSSLKTFLQSAYSNLEPTQKEFADFNAANG